MTRPDADFDHLVAAGPAGGQGDLEQHEPVGTRIDAWWGRMLGTPLRQKLWYWGGPLAVTLLAAVLRLWRLGDPHALVFDETFYVKDAYTLMNLGYEGSWPADADAHFNAGDTTVFTTNGSYVVHPPLGKWLISLGIAVFGAQDSVGWRISTAIVGILAVFVVAMIARALFRSTVLATIAGGLMAIDGHAIVLSRISLLDNFLMLFALLGFWAVLLDREHSKKRLYLWMVRRMDAGRSIDWGPALWRRPWLFTAGLLFGLACGVKWNGVYFLAAFAVYTLVVDAIARRKAGITFWASGTIFKQAIPSFLLTVPIALATFLATWTGWFVTQDGYFRQWATVPGNAITGAFSWIPLSVQSFWHYQASAYMFHLDLHTPHAYQSNPLLWFLLARPTAFYYVGTSQGQDGCDVQSCASYITSIPNPLIWYAAVAAIFYLVYRLIRYREWRVGLILMGMVAGYLPWLLYTGRTVFEFYSIAFEPYMILGLVFVIGLILGTPTDPTWKRLGGIRLVAVFLILAVLISAFFYPVWTGMQIPTWFSQLHYWLPGWR